VLLSPDGSKVYSSTSGDVTIGFWLNPTNDQIHFGIANSFSGFQDLAISGDGGTLDVAGQFADSSLNAQADTCYIDWETWFPSGTLGQKLNQDGSILFQPLTDGVDMIARNTGRLLYRIQIPVTIPDIYDALVVANGQNNVAIISANAVSFVDLSSLPIASEFAQPFEDRVGFTAGSFADSQNVLRPSRYRSNRRNHWMAKPKLKRPLSHATRSQKSRP